MDAQCPAEHELHQAEKIFLPCSNPARCLTLTYMKVIYSISSYFSTLETCSADIYWYDLSVIISASGRPTSITQIYPQLYFDYFFH